MADQETIQNFALLFDRPNETLITPKGEENAVFQLTENFLANDYKANGIELNNRFGDEASRKIPLKNLRRIPAFPKASRLGPDEDFSLFLPKHQEMANEVIAALMKVNEGDLQELLSTCVYSRVHLNPQLFNYCYSVALTHRQDTKNFPVTNFAESFPAKFMNPQTFQQARQSAFVIPKGIPRSPIIIPRDYTATDLEEEHRLAYFREDIGVNLHHWHWHRVYPFTSSDRSMVEKDRRGELFFYMHQQIIARYNGERLNNSLKRVVMFSNWREPIPESYFPKLDSLTSSRGYPPRQANMRWQDVKRPVDGINLTVDTMERWRKNIQEAIDTGFVRMSNGQTRPLDMDTLGNMVEASILSPNSELYGALHNSGHILTGYIHDPEHRYLENFAVFADEAITMRDPFFYRWHGFIDDLFQGFKESGAVRPYTNSELNNEGVQVVSAAIEGQGGQNSLKTFWMLSDVDISKGLDFSDRGPVYARFTHLNHVPFRYVINVNNTGSARRATVRIFLAPKLDERKRSWELSDHRKMFIEMDKFVTPLNAGRNTITRQSSESSVVIPFEQTFRDLSSQGSAVTRANIAQYFCGCGWPEHMLVPKGTEAGAQYQLFVMLSNYEMDRVDQSVAGTTEACKEAFSFCGLKDRLYPDRRAMGFPFDRPSRTASSIEDFVLPNMALVDVTIQLQDRTVNNPRNPTQ